MKPVVNLPLYARSLLHTSDTTLEPLPEITHQMRPPAKRASPVMSGTFTILTILPLLVLIVTLLQLKLNLSRLQSILSIGFVVSLFAVFLFYAAYWFAVEGVSFYDTIRYICLLLPITWVTGRYALLSVQSLRTKPASHGSSDKKDL